MFSQKINVTELKDSVRKIIFDAHKLLLENFKSMDFEKTVGSALKKCGYVYSIDTASGDFTITAAPGYYIKAYWKDELYDVHIEINVLGLKTDTIGMTKNSHYLNPEIKQWFLISPFCIENYKPIFDKIIEDLRTEYAKYESAVKGDIGAKLLKSMITPCLKDNKLSKVNVEKIDEDSRQFLLIKKICENVFLRTTISFENYEDGIIRVANAYNRIPNWIKESKGLFITSKDHYFNVICCKICGKYKTGDSYDRKMKYGTLPPLYDSINHEAFTTNLSQKLQELGFLFYMDDCGMYNIYLNDQILLCRNGSAAYIKRVSGEVLSETIMFEQSEFIILLKIIAWGTAPNMSLDLFFKKFVTILLNKPLENILPDSSVCTFFDQGIGFYYKGNFYDISVKSSSLMSLIWDMLKDVHSNENIREALVFDGVETIIKDRYGNYSILKL